jgi:hypothetical protein
MFNYPIRNCLIPIRSDPSFKKEFQSDPKNSLIK